MKKRTLCPMENFQQRHRKMGTVIDFSIFFDNYFSLAHSKAPLP